MKAAQHGCIRLGLRYASVASALQAGYMKVLGKGQLPEQPLIVKVQGGERSTDSSPRAHAAETPAKQARYFTKEAEEKIKAAGSSLPSAIRSGRGLTLMHLRRWRVRAVRLEPVSLWAAVRSLGVESVHQKAEHA